MRRALLTSLAAILLLGLMASPALAEQPSQTCPAAASGWTLVDRDGWVDVTLGGIAEMGIDVTDPAALDAFAQSLGVPNWAAVEDFIRNEQWAQLDRNQDDLLCIQDLPNTPGRPGFIFNGRDNGASVPVG